MDRARADEDGLSVRRLFSPTLGDPGQELALEADAARHARVLRLAVGDALELFDGRGGSARARVVRIGKRELACRVESEVQRAPRGPRVVLVQCVPKGGKLDDIVRMTTELGVSAIHLAWSQRCVARAGREQTRERLLRVAIEAARQSEQAYLPHIAAPLPLLDVLRAAPAGALKVAFAERTAEPIAVGRDVEEAWVVVGPEGGLSDQDRGELSAAGYRTASLGSAILRTETAAVVGVGVLLERLRQRR